MFGCYVVVLVTPSSLQGQRGVNIVFSSARWPWPICSPHSRVQRCTKLPQFYKGYQGESLISAGVAPGRDEWLLSKRQNTSSRGTSSMNCSSHRNHWFEAMAAILYWELYKWAMCPSAEPYWSAWSLGQTQLCIWIDHKAELKLHMQKSICYIYKKKKKGGENTKSYISISKPISK